MDYRLVLIHGTFACRAKWVRDDSEFAEHLKTLLVKDTNNRASTEPFYWSGWLLEASRRKHALRLAARLEEIRRTDPTTKLILVGHSHAGNLIRHVLSEPEVGRSVDAVVTLATPFICARYRHPTKAFRLLLSMFHDLLLGVPVFVAMLAPHVLSGSGLIAKSSVGFDAVALVSFVVFFLALFSALLPRRCFRALDGLIHDQRRRAYRRLTPRPLATPLLCFNNHRDPAASHYRRQGFIDWLAEFFYHLPILRLMIRFAVICVGAVVVGGLGYVFMKGESPGIGTIAMVLVGGPTVILFMRVAAATLFLGTYLCFQIPFRWLVQGCSYGVLGPADNFWIRLTHALTPPAWAGAVLRESPDDTNRQGLFALHALYEEPKVREDIACWLPQVCAALPVSSPAA